MQFKDMLRREDEVEPAGRPAPGKSIVIAEKDPASREAIQAQVADLGYTPIPVTSGEAAVLMAREHRPRLVIVNLDLDGAGVVARLRENPVTRSIGVVLISNTSETPDAVAGVQIGANEYICKPIDGASVKSRIRKLLLRDSEDVLQPMLQPITMSGPPPTESAVDPAGSGDRMERAETLYARCCDFARDALARARGGDPPDIEWCRTLSGQLVRECETNNRLLLKAIRPYEAGTTQHDAVNVAIFSVKIGRGLNYDHEELTALAMAALCHEVGMSCVPEDVMKVEGKYSKRELGLIQQHPEHAFHILGKLGEKYAWLAEAVYAEHEREKGQGYPRQLRGDEITEFAKVIGLADTYESLSHPRTFRKAFIAFDALREIIGMRNTYFAAPIIRALVSEVSVFPLESYVLLNTGEVARVVRTNADNLLRPTVVIEYDSGLQKLKRPKLVDLASRPLLYVAKPVDERELPKP